MIKQTFKVDYQLKYDEQGRQMLFISSYQNNIKIEEHFVGYINDILTENKKYKEVIDKLNKLEDIRLLTMYFEDGGEISVLPYEDILDILKEVE